MSSGQKIFTVSEQETKEYVLPIMRGLAATEHYESATQLAEDTADMVGGNHWLDDPMHWIWDMAVEVYNA